MKKTLILLLTLTVFSSCNSLETHYHDGKYALVITISGINVNANENKDPQNLIIINGNHINLFGTRYNCKQYPDRIEVDNGSKILNISESGDIVFNISLGEVQYRKISDDTSLLETNMQKGSIKQSSIRRNKLTTRKN